MIKNNDKLQLKIIVIIIITLQIRHIQQSVDKTHILCLEYIQTGFPFLRINIKIPMLSLYIMFVFEITSN